MNFWKTSNKPTFLAIEFDERIRDLGQLENACTRLEPKNPARFLVIVEFLTDPGDCDDKGLPSTWIEGSRRREMTSLGDFVQ